jgi:hypothetical protein
VNKTEEIIVVNRKYSGEIITHFKTILQQFPFISHKFDIFATPPFNSSEPHILDEIRISLTTGQINLSNQERNELLVPIAVLEDSLQPLSDIKAVAAALKNGADKLIINPAQKQPIMTLQRTGKDHSRNIDIKPRQSKFPNLIVRHPHHHKPNSS